MAHNLFKNQRNATKIPQTTAMQKQRIKQVTSVRNHFPSVTEVEKDSEYQLRFTTPLGTEHTLYLQLTPNFPNERPSVLVYPPLDHPCFDKECFVVAYKPLNDFTMHQDLGKVLENLVRELSSHRPTPKPKETDNPNSFSPLPSFSFPANSISSYTTPITMTLHNLSPVVSPKVSREVARVKWINYEAIESLTLDQLIEMDSATDDGKLLGFVDFEGFQAEGEGERVRLIQDNLELAQENLQMEPELLREKETLRQKKSRLSELLLEFRASEGRQGKLSEFSEFRVINSLEQLATEDNTQADTLAEAFLGGKMGHLQFLNEFIKKREIYYLRSAKQQKLQRVMTEYRNIQTFPALK